MASNHSGTSGAHKARSSDQSRHTSRTGMSVPATVNGMTSRRPGSLSSMTDIERQMEEEVEKALRKSKPWESKSKLKGFKLDTFHLGPSENQREANSEGPSRRHDRRRRIKSTPASGTARLEIPEIDVIRRENTNLNTSTESLNDDERRNLYSTCSDTGQKIFKMEFDMKGYEEDNITVKVKDGRLIIHAVQVNMDEGHQTTNEFCRKIKLPSDVMAEKLRFVLNNNKLVVESPLRPTFPLASSNGNFPSDPSAMNDLNLDEESIGVLNSPVIRSSTEVPGTQELHLHVEVGRVFQADDVTVKVKGQDRVLVSAERHEDTGSSKLSANLSREFILPAKIIAKSLSAGFTVDGILKIQAELESPKPVTVIVSGSSGDVHDVKTYGSAAEESH